MLALALGLALGAESPGGPSKVTADTGKVAVPLEEEASSLGFAKVSAFAEGAASEVVGQTSEVQSEQATSYIYTYTYTYTYIHIHTHKHT